MRLFVAVDLPEETRREIAARQKLIAAPLVRSGGSLKLVAPEQMHLTLLFLGEVQEARVPAAIETMNTAVDLPAFDMAFGGAGVFPPRGAPRVLWIGVTVGAASLTSLQREFAERIRRLGIAFDDRPFHPHLTLGRWRESRGKAKAVALDEVAEITSMRVTRATLYQSRLSASGPAYTALAHATLTQAVESRIPDRESRH
jgi:RNA 2',3'-cyclic 3'-phosphodiesterase